ncbi:MAG: tRNA lysidine(34) synthetase TilS [Actinobacteria bacterium HGW-Actinobacteria-6]|jgi:tRNA(Ile)-lysidine synthase|nr:MAG: tRNA lysidine(34) synthetase TilS [Actinobacteria bacterium HGW-Actinobacteria-6]
MTPLTEIARIAVAEHEMLPAGSVVLALVSGGADSVAMLRLLASRDLGEFAGLSVLHVNHMLRGEASDGDATSVEVLCEALGVPCTVARFDVGAYAEAEGLNLEDAGRRIRYRFADSEVDSRCEALGLSPLRGRIAVAHTLDDQAETFLMRLVTGAGPGGLRAIAPVRGRVVRPLIGARRAEIVSYLTGLNQPWREDATNADTSRLRSWVRHDLLPLAQTRNPAFAETLARNVRIIAEEDSLLSEMASAFSRDFASFENGRLAFESQQMRTLSRPMARRTIREALLRAFPDASRLEAAHIEALVEGLSVEAFAHDLPFGLRAADEYGKLYVSRRDDVSPSVAPCLLEWPGRCDLGMVGSIEAALVAPGDLTNDPFSAFVDADTLRGVLTVDGPRDGDRMTPLGMTGTKKLQDLLTDVKVPKRLRAGTPVIRDGAGIVWVAGVRLDERCKVTAETRRVLALSWYRPEVGS